MSNGNKNDPNQRGADGATGSRDFSEAVTRLERSVQDLVSVAKDQTFDKATRFIDETSKRIESELRYNRVSDEDADEDRDRRRRRRRHRHARARRRYTPQMPRAAGMYRNTEDEKIGGVCSGLARYFGVETWVVRLGALTGLIFLPGVVFPAYWVAYFVMGREPASFADSKSRNSKRRSRRHSRSSKAVEPGAMLSGGAIAMDEPDEFQISPRRSLRNSGADFSQIELRLRRMESFVTSGQYELHKELAKLDDTGSQDHARER